MNIPLFPSAARAANLQSPGSNAGLVFDKFFASWNATFTELQGASAKLNWVNRFANAACPCDPNWAARQRALVEALGGTVWRATATSRFITGTGIANPLENGFVWHHSFGCPYLPASGLKGALGAYWRQWDGNDIACAKRLFGEAAQAGAAMVFDMIPFSGVRLCAEVMTPHYGPWYQKGEIPGDWHDPVPIPFLAVEAGAVFQIAVAPRVGGNAQPPAWRDDLNLLRRRLSEKLEWTGLGAKTAVGYGRFKLGERPA